jgi:uncharacterized protein (DUF1697 family)
MKRYVAFLRGVSPVNAKMPELKRAFERAGFQDVRTVLSSGNVVFSTAYPEKGLEAKAEAAMKRHLGASFLTFVRSVDALQKLVASDPCARFELGSDSKRVVTFLRSAPGKKPALPIEMDGASILLMKGCEAFSAYVPGPKGPVFMTLIEKTFGKDVTTRTWDTVKKVAK